MKNLFQRLLLFFVAVPALVAGVVLLPHLHHLLILLVVLAFLVGSSLELGRLVSPEGSGLSRPWFVAQACLPSLILFGVTFLPPIALGPAWAASVLVATLPAFGALAFSADPKLPTVLPRAGAYALGGAYLGLLGGAVTLVVSGFAASTVAILAFAVVVFGNDSLAWLFGVTLGKKRRLVAASPNKSLAGFIGGLSGSAFGALALAFLAPEAFPGPKALVLGFGLAVGAAAIVGDLFESALKRSAGVKDSGNLVPGRGGFLDSFDSVLFAAPVFLLCATLLGYFA